MKTPKKVLSLLLIAVMLVSMLCMGVSATTTYEEVSISEGEPVTICFSFTEQMALFCLCQIQIIPS